MEREHRRVGLEFFVQLLRMRLAVRLMDMQEPFAVPIQHQRQYRLGLGRQLSRGHCQRTTIHCQYLGERQASIFRELRNAHLLFILTQDKYLRAAIAVPIRRPHYADAAQAWECLPRPQCAIILLQADGQFAALRLGRQQIRAPITIHIGPDYPPLLLVCAPQRHDLQLAALQGARQYFWSAPRQVMHLCPA